MTQERKPLLTSFSPNSYYCKEAIIDGARKEMTVVIVPNSLKETSGKTVISWACNYGRVCENASCIYALALKDEPNKRIRLPRRREVNQRSTLS